MGTTWYRDLWLVTVQDGTASASFVYNFAADGMAGTPDYSVVADLYHGMYWGVPGYNAGGALQDERFVRDGLSAVVKPGDTGGGALALASVASSTTTETTTNPPRQERRTDRSIRSAPVSAPVSARGGAAAAGMPQ